jgi:translation initiation factor IF-3
LLKGDDSLKGKKEALPLINEKIRVEQLQLITSDGENIGIVPTYKALRMAQDVHLDLVMIAEVGKEGVPVAKIMDFGKVLYEKKKQQGEAKKHQKVIQIKEVKMSPKIGEHDYQIKMKQAIEFLEEGKRVKITLFFKGRENMLKDKRGAEIFDKVMKTFEDHDILKNLVQEEDTRAGQIWSRVYYLKNVK